MLEANPYDLFHPVPLLIVISGPSGVGKDAVLNRLREREVSFHFVVTATTRERRKGERDGFDYIFVSVEEFERMIAEDELLEYAKVYDDYKGIPKEQVRQAIDSGKDVILRIDVQGAETIRKLCPEVVTIFLIVRDEDELVYRLQTRKSESPEKIQQRIETARKELRRVDEFDYVVENPDNKLDDTVGIIEAIIQAEHHRVQHRKVNL
ncbi:MAG: guanylate kinase [Anaerolineales bacterium]|jgi:guanylate kinase|nr:guanylate kinase [Anaerolineales bacterium]